jgi:predicted DNA-binding transcriptional regulator AlpA
MIYNSADTPDLLSSYEVLRITGLHWNALLPRLRAGAFPLPILDTAHRIRWHRSEVEPYRRRG